MTTTLLHDSASGPGFHPCAACGCLVLRDPHTGEDRSPALGYPHRCGENCACRTKED